MFSTSLAEKYRPQQWSEVIGQSKAVKQLLALKTRTGLQGRAYWISGKSGQGKTTIARLIAADVASDWMTVEVDATGLTVSELADLERQSHLAGMGKPGRAYIVNEAHGLRRDVVRQLLVMLERIPPHVVWVFTTTNEGQEALFEDIADASPLLSRCLVIKLTSQGVNPAFAAYLRECAQAEGLDGQPIEKYKRLLNDCGNNLRAAFQSIESGEMMP